MLVDLTRPEVEFLVEIVRQVRDQSSTKDHYRGFMQRLLNKLDPMGNLAPSTLLDQAFR